MQSVILFSLSNFITSGFPVGISNLDIWFLSNLNKYLHNPLIEFPCAEIKILFFEILFSISSVWNDLIEKKELYGFESSNKFYHLTDLETFKKLQDL